MSVYRDFRQERGIEAGQELTIPSPIDVHVHLREPGGEDMETIQSGTRAAVNGGYQAVFDMPNNPNGNETWTAHRLEKKIEIAKRTSHTNIGFYAGVDLGDPNLDELRNMYEQSAGLKLYMGHTTGNAKEYDLEAARQVIDFWMGLGVETGTQLPILLHARGGVGEETARYVASNEHPVHWCHIASEEEVDHCAALAYDFQSLFTAGVTPHHLTMTEQDADFKYGWPGGRMMPPLGRPVDHDKLVSAFQKGVLSILESDHAPHTSRNKMRAEAENPEGNTAPDCITCFGVSGIEFVLPVMMSLVARKKITLDRLVDSLHEQPRRMLRLPVAAVSGETTISVGPYQVESKDQVGASANNPYVGWTAWAKVTATTINDSTRFKHQTYVPDFKPQILRAVSEE